MSDKTEKKYMKKSEIVTFGIGLFGVALMTGWMPDYTATFFADFAFKGKGFDSATMANAISMVFLVAGIIGAVCELVIGYLVDNTRTKLGKVKPWVGFGVVPLAVVAMLVFIAPNTSNQTLAIVWMFVIYSLYTAFSCAVESPSNCFGSLCSPNPAERSTAISIASFLRSVGQSGGMVVVMVVGLVMKALMGKQQYKNAEGQGLDLVISTAVCALGLILFVMIFFTNNKERVPFTQEKVSLKDAVKVVFTYKNLLMVSLTKLCGFGRGVYGASSMAILFLVSKGIGFNSTLIVPFLILNFFCGLQHGNTNVTPNIMIADCVDEIEWKTGQRKDGLAYAGYGLFSKIASAFTKALGPWLLYTWSGYAVSRDANVAYAAQTDSTLNKILMIYTIIPAVFVVLQAVPIFFYDMVGEKKARITRELMERREAAGLVAGEGEETADAAAAE